MRFIAICSVLVCLFTGCAKNGDKAAAETSVSVDLDDTKDSVKKTFNNAEREIKKGAEKAQAKLEDAGDAIKEKIEETKDKLSDDKKAGISVEVKKD